MTGDLLYHYTTAAGCLGIVETGTIFATDCRFVNDTRELKHGLDTIASAMLTERLAGSTASDQDAIRSLLRWLRDFMDSEPIKVAPYIACFSAKDDQLSQWRGYGSNEVTFSLGFDREAMRQHLSKPNREYTTRLLQVEYDESKQRELFENVLWPAGRVAYIRSGSGSLFFAGRALEAAIACKHDGFSEEEEWRIVVPIRGLGINPKGPEHFHVRNGIQVPFIRVALAESGSQLPLVRVRYFPGGDGGGEVEAGLSAVLQKYGYPDVEIRASRIPFRR